MRLTQNTAGIAALIAAATFVVGFAMAIGALPEYAAGRLSPTESAAFVAENQALLTVWYIVILIVFGVALVPLVLGLHDRLQDGEPALARTATAFGLIWAGLVIAAGMIATVSLGTVADLHDADPARASSAWSAIDAVQNGIGGGTEVVGGIWVLLVSLAAVRTGALPRALGYLGIATAVAALMTVVPALESVGAVFGVGMIAWFTWSGATLIRDEPAVTPRIPAAAA